MSYAQEFVVFPTLIEDINCTESASLNERKQSSILFFHRKKW